MSDVIDWSKAPGWADKHGLVGMCRNPAWLNDSQYTYVDGQKGGRAFYFGGNGYSLCSVRDVTALPQPTQWSGEGLPPVGTVCEWFSPVYGWLGGKVVGHDGTASVIVHNDGYTGCHPHEVRPTRTPEQIAADERSKYCDRIYGVMCKAASPYNRSDMAEVLYDAGLRFTE